MAEKEPKTDFRTSDRWLMFGLVLGPLAALANLTVSYSLVQTACERGSKLILHTSMVAFFIVSLIGALIGRRYAHPTAGDRTRWLASVTIYLALASAVVILAMEIPNVILRSCD